jgi:hypothetical protein
MADDSRLGKDARATMMTIDKHTIQRFPSQGFRLVVMEKFKVMLSENARPARQSARLKASFWTRCLTAELRFSEAGA